MSIFWKFIKFARLSNLFERRKAFRHIINIPADYSTSEEEAVYLFYNTVDISESGASQIHPKMPVHPSKATTVAYNPAVLRT